jgi:RNA polymerase sigma-70 factor (ECF subfamily)
MRAERRSGIKPYKKMMRLGLFPERFVSERRFTHMIADKEPANDPDSIATRASLLGRLKTWDDADSWEDFTQTYWKLIYGVARQAGLSDDEARDVVQETLLGVARNIHKFESSPERGSFKNWLLNLTRWRITDRFRDRMPVDPSAPPPHFAGDHTATIERLPDSAEINSVWETEWRKSVFDTAVARVCRRVKPRHAQIFDLYAIRDWPAAKVARELGVSLIQVYLVNHRLTKLLKAEVAYLRKKLE